MNEHLSRYGKILLGSFLLGVAISFSGCGKGGGADSGGGLGLSPVPNPGVPGSVIAPVSGTCPGGFNVSGTGVCVPGDFVTACQNAAYYGVSYLPVQTQILQLGSTPVCQTTFKLFDGNHVNYGLTALPALGGAVKQGLSLGGQVIAGDTVSFGSVSGGWQSGFCFGGSLNPDFAVSDGYQTYAVASGARVRIAQGGPLSIGFPVSAGTSGCWSLKWSGATVSRCLDAAGNSYACP